MPAVGPNPGDPTCQHHWTKDGIFFPDDPVEYVECEKCGNQADKYPDVWD